MLFLLADIKGKPLYLLSLLLFFAGEFFILQGQNQDQDKTIRLESVIIDKLSGKEVAYASILNFSNKEGTVSNLRGIFGLDNVLLTDSIAISFIGYRTISETASFFYGVDTIFLQRIAVDLDELIILADDAYLYEMIEKVSKTGSKEIYTAKTYLSLESYIENQQVELLEGYFNGNYSTYNIKELALKNGRIALADYKERFFLSTGTSRAILMNNLFIKNAYFPGSPLVFNKRKCRKYFQLKLVSIYSDADSNTIYVIEYTPREKYDEFFHGKVWIDSVSQQLLKVELNIKNTLISPFLPLWVSDEISSVGFNISRTFCLHDGIRKPESASLTYHIHYKDRLDSSYTVKTNAILYAYDFSDKFTLPFFRFTENKYPDYVKIGAVPYNDFFWQYINEFKLSDIQNKNEDFINHKADIKNRDLFVTSRLFSEGLYQYGYVFWSERRIVFQDIIIDTAVTDNSRYKFPADGYHLSAQIYMDVNRFNDSLNVLSCSIFDPFESFYTIERTIETNAFINIYFDLVEIKRRELIAEFTDGEISQEKLEQLYKAKIAETNAYLDSYLSKVDRGTNKEEMMMWNNIVANVLEIDNLKFFNIYQEVK